MKTFEKIIKPYEKTLAELDYKNINNIMSPDIFLFMKWAYRVEKGWYGFALDGAPLLWAVIINDFLHELELVAPNFKIHQIKLKYGGLRFHVVLRLDDTRNMQEIQNNIRKLENMLTSDGLIY